MERESESVFMFFSNFMRDVFSCCFDSSLASIFERFCSFSGDGLGLRLMMLIVGCWTFLSGESSSFYSSFFRVECRSFERRSTSSFSKAILSQALDVRRLFSVPMES